MDSSMILMMSYIFKEMRTRARFYLMILKAGMLDLQTQLYILSATFGAVIFLLILLVLVLALSVARWVIFTELF